MEPNGTAPSWLEPLIEQVGRDPLRRWREADLRSLGLAPNRVRRWFLANHGMTFLAYQRARRLGLALGKIKEGGDLTAAAYDHGYESLSGFREAFERFFGGTPGRTRGATLVSVTRILTPLGPMVAGATEDGVCLLEFADRPMLETQVSRLRRLLDCGIAPGSNAHTRQLAVELERYFAGELKVFTKPLVLRGSSFQTGVWTRLRDLPYGSTATYDSLANDIERPSARRAVARANGDNRLAILVPCHRVIGSDGKLRGYGGGLWRKQFLLEHERRHR